MKGTSLDKFNALIDAEYPEIKQYIIQQKDKTVILEDYEGDFTFGSNPHLNALFEWPSKFNVKKATVSYNEHQKYFTITLELN